MNTQAELIEKAKQWIREKYPKGECSEDFRMEYLGVLVDFITDVVPTEAPLQNEPSSRKLNL